MRNKELKELGTHSSEEGKLPSSEEGQLCQSEETLLLKSLKVLQKLSRRISQFLRDHRYLYKSFVFGGQEHQLALLRHAYAVGQFLKEHGSEQSKPFWYCQLDGNNCLQFSDVDDLQHKGDMYVKSKSQAVLNSHRGLEFNQ